MFVIQFITIYSLTRNLDSIICSNKLVVLVPEYTWDRIAVYGTRDAYVTAFGEL